MIIPAHTGKGPENNTHLGKKQLLSSPAYSQTRAITEKLFIKGPAMRGSLIMDE
jgi:hypothetical protein